jgi:hypothetical protein
MGENQEWAEAENALLGVTCEFTKGAHSLRFESPQKARRFNGVRILDPRMQDGPAWEEELRSHGEAFAAREMPLSVQLALPHKGDSLPGYPEGANPRAPKATSAPKWPVDLAATKRGESMRETGSEATENRDWSPSGPIYHHLATDLSDFIGEGAREIELKELSEESEILVFAEMMMVDRIPESMHEKARPSIVGMMQRAAALPQTTMMLAYHGNDCVGQVALVEAKGDHCHGYNVSTLSVDETFRGQGYMKSLYNAIGKSFQGWLYGQIIEGKPTMAYRQRFPSTRHLATVRTYQRNDDPFGDRWAEAS